MSTNPNDSREREEEANLADDRSSQESEEAEVSEKATGESIVDSEILEHLPPEVRRTVREMFMGVIGPARHPVLSKVTP